MSTGAVAYKNVEHPILLTGEAFSGQGYEPDALGFFTRNLERVTRDAARITVTGTSRGVGRPIKDLELAWKLRVAGGDLDSKRGGRVFVAYLPKVGDVAPRLFKQRSLFGDDLNPEDTVLDWFGDVTSAVMADNSDSAMLDEDLLGNLAKFKKVRQKGFESASISTPRYQVHHEVTVNEELGLRADSLVQATPKARIARIKGFLNNVAFLERNLLLNLQGSKKLRVHWQPEDITDVKALLGSDVVLEGSLQFKANGTPLILIADRVQVATDKDSAWAELPSGRSEQPFAHRLQLAQNEENPLERLRGLLDGHVDDDTFARMVEEFCRA